MAPDDDDGFVRYYHPGEGAYDETEQKIRELLAERRAVLNGTEAVTARGRGRG